MKIVTFNALGRYGRFANGMYQIAGTIGIARKNGFDFAFPYWQNHWHAEAFGSSEDIDVQRHFVKPLPIYNGPSLPDRAVEWGYHNVVLTESVSLSGHLQSTKYFAHCLDEVQSYFRMVDEPPLNDLCAVHVRLGDYDNKYHPRLDARYYLQAMRLFPEGQHFLVFSDDIKSVEEMFNAAGLSGLFNLSVSHNRDYLQDFKLMKTCRHFIIGNSSYSAMAAVLGEADDKKVIAPRPWFGPAYAQISGDDIYNDDWIVVNY